MSEQNQSPEKQDSKKVIEPSSAEEQKSSPVSDKELDSVAGGLNPQPLPPRIAH